MRARLSAAVALGLAGAAVVLTQWPSGAGAQQQNPPEATVSIVSPSAGYSPSQVSVPPGGEVLWRNDDADNQHTVTSDSTRQGEAFNSDGVFPGGMARGDTFVVGFDSPGTYPYHCRIYPGMKGTVVVPGGGTTAPPPPPPPPSTTATTRATTTTRAVATTSTLLDLTTSTSTSTSTSSSSSSTTSTTEPTTTTFDDFASEIVNNDDDGVPGWLGVAGVLLLIAVAAALVPAWRSLV